MTAQSIRQSKAIAAYAAEVRKQEERARIARLERARRRLVRRFVTERNGWLFAAAIAGAAAAVVAIKVI